MLTPPTKRIGLLFGGLLTSYPVTMRNALERSARRRSCSSIMVLGRQLEHPDVNERTQNAAYEWVSSSCVDGVIALSGVMGSAATVAGVLERLAPMPTVSLGLDLAGLPSITVDNRLGVSKAVQHLLGKHGARRIAYISGPRDNPEANARLDGYRDALLAHGLTPSPSLIAHGSFSMSTGAACMGELLDREPLIDAVVAANDYLALGALNVIQSRGMAVPNRNQGHRLRQQSSGSPIFPHERGPARGRHGRAGPRGTALGH